MQSQEQTSRNALPCKYTKLFLVTISYLVIEYLFRNILKEMSMKYFFTIDAVDCSHMKNFSFYDNGGKYFIMYLLYNYINVYSALFFAFIEVFGLYLSSLCHIYFNESRPYKDHLSLIPCFNINDLRESPCETVMILFLSFSTVYQAFIQKKNTPERKLVCFSLGFIVITFTSYVKLCQNQLYLNHILLGLGHGYALYILFYEIIQIKFEDYHLLKYALKYKTVTFLVILNLFILINYLQYRMWIRTGVCIVNTQGYFTCNNNQVQEVQIGRYYISSKLFELLGYFLGILFEYRCFLNKNDDVFIRYNISERNQNSMEMFNNTKGDTSVFRLVLFCLCHFYIQFNPSMDSIQYESYPWNHALSFWSIVHILPILSRIHYGLVLFYGLKWLIRQFGLSNERLFTTDIDKTTIKKILDQNAPLNPIQQDNNNLNDDKGLFDI